MVTAIINDKGALKMFSTTLVYIMISLLLLVFVILFRPNLFIYSIVFIPLLPILLFILINKLEYSILLYIAISPLIQHYSFVHASLGDFKITPDMVIHLILLIATLNHFLYSYNATSNRKLSLLDKLLILFVLMSVFSLIAASYFPINHTKRILLYYTGVLQPVSFYFIIIYFLTRFDSFTKKLILAVTITASAAAFIAFIELKEIGASLINIYFARNIIGFGYHNTNLFGMHVALVFPLYFYALNSGEFKKFKYIIWLNFILISILAVLTLNRGTFVVLIVYLFILFWKKDNRNRVIGFIIAGTIASLYFIDLIILYINRFLGGGEQAKLLADQSALYRVEIWRVALEAISMYPLGMGGAGYYYAWKTLSIDPSRIFATPHQILLYVAIDYGVPALIAFIFLIFIVFKNASHLSRYENFDHSKLFYYLKIALIGYFIHGFLTGGEFSHLSGNLFPNNGYSYLLMILLAIVSYYYGKYKNL